VNPVVSHDDRTVRGGVRMVRTAIRTVAHFISSILAAVLIFVIRAYQSIHIAFFRGSCRFHPTCSHYALEAIQVHGPGRGSLLAAWRVLRCQPFCRGGFDPVPEPKRNKTERSQSVPDVTLST